MKRKLETLNRKGSIQNIYDKTQKDKSPKTGLSYSFSLGVYKPDKNDTFRFVLQFQNTKLIVPGGSKWSHRNGGQIIQVDQCRAC